MSDKKTYNKDFVDRGWKDMSSILDKEMPVKKKKRRFVFWLFFVGIIAAGTVVWMGLNALDSSNIRAETMEIESVNKDVEKSITNSNINSELNSNLNKDDSVVKYEYTANEGNDIENKNEIVEWSIADEDEVISNELNSIKKEINNNAEDYNSNFNIQELKNIESIRHLFKDENKNGQEGSIIEIVKGKIEVLNKSIKTISVASDKNDFIKENDEAIEKRETIKLLEPIAFSTTKDVEFFNEESLPFNPKFGFWEFGIEAGLVYQNKNELGAKLAFVASKRFKPKWSLHTGLEYNVQFVNYSVDEQVDNSFADLETDYMGTGTSLGGINEALENLQQSPTNINSHFIKIPALIGYRFNRSFEITGGIIGSTLVYSGKGTIGNNQEQSNTSSPNSVLDMNAREMTPLFDLQSSIGMTYYPNSKWAVNVRYDNGFIQRKIKYKESLTSNPELSLKGYNSKNRQLSLSLRMYF